MRILFHDGACLLSDREGLFERATRRQGDVNLCLGKIIRRHEPRRQERYQGEGTDEEHQGAENRREAVMQAPLRPGEVAL